MTWQPSLSTRANPPRNTFSQNVMCFIISILLRKITDPSSADLLFGRGNRDVRTLETRQHPRCCYQIKIQNKRICLKVICILDKHITALERKWLRLSHRSTLGINNYPVSVQCDFTSVTVLSQIGRSWADFSSALYEAKG